MKTVKGILIFSIIGLAKMNSLCQTNNNLGGDKWTISAYYGLGKTQYFFGYTPAYTLASDENAFKYSPSWSCEIAWNSQTKKSLNLSLGVVYTAISEISKHTARPPWIINSGIQSTSFIHLVPSCNLVLKKEVCIFSIGAYVGTAIGMARRYSNSLGKLHADFGLRVGSDIRLLRGLYLNPLLFLGVTKYDYENKDMPEFSSFYKHHAFLLGIKYVLNNK